MKKSSVDVESSELDADCQDIPLLFCTDLDSHANVITVSKHAAIINDDSRRSEVIPFNLDYESLRKIP